MDLFTQIRFIVFIDIEMISFHRDHDFDIFEKSFFGNFPSNFRF